MFKTFKLMVQGQTSFIRLLALALLLFVSGCAAPIRPGEMTIADIEASRLGFLKAGVTTKNEVKSQLGTPTFSVAKETVWGYRMTLYSRPRFLPGTYWRWGRPDYSHCAAIPKLHVQRNLDTDLSVTESSAVAGAFVYPYELVLVFEESRLKVFRVFSFRNWWPR